MRSISCPTCTSAVSVDDNGVLFYPHCMPDGRRCVQHILIGRQVTTTKPASEAPATRGQLNLHP